MYSTSKYREDSELSLLIDSISCLFSSLWSSHNTVRLTWDKTSLTASANSPSSISFRPDIIFSTKLSNGQEYETGNGEVKAPSVKKCIVDATRVSPLRFTSLATSMAIAHMRKSLGGELPRFNKVNGVLTHALRSMLTLKRSMELSLADIDTNNKNIDGLIESNLLPTVSYVMIYKESVNDRATDSNSQSAEKQVCSSSNSP